ncbi:MAG: clostripain-related cysteine peptidase, partial [Candidatus Rifleibacteriota bacterium]
MQRFIGLVIVPVMIAAILLCGCSGESGPTLVFPFPVPTDLKVSGAIKLSDVAVHGSLGGISPSLLDYRPFKLSVQDDSSISGESDEEGRFNLTPMSIRDQYVIFAKNSKYKGFVLEYMAADSSGLYGEQKIEISIRSTAASLIARCLRDRYGRRINPSALGASHLDSTVKAIADVLESHPEKIASVALDQVAEVKAAYTAMAESLNNGQSGVVPNNLVLLLYMGGDNNLAGFINSNIADIEEAGLPGGTQVIIQADIAVHGMKRLLFYDGRLVELASVADVDSSSGAVVADFVAWSRRAFPASRYCLVISSHADGWKNASSLRSSLISDQTSETKGNPIEIAAWVKGANTQFDGFYRPLDLLVFDACNMASLEIAREFKDTSSYMVFSQAFVPGSGFPYGQIMKKIQATGSSGMDGEKLGRLFCEAYKERYLDGALVTAVTVSLLKSSELPAFIGYLQNFFTQVQNNIGKLGPVLASLRDSKMVIAEGASETYVIQSFETSDNRDLHEMF